MIDFCNDSVMIDTESTSQGSKIGKSNRKSINFTSTHSLFAKASHTKCNFLQNISYFLVRKTIKRLTLKEKVNIENTSLIQPSSPAFV